MRTCAVARLKRNNTSLTRCQDKEFPQLLARLKSDVEKPGIIVRAAGVISVRQIKDIGLSNPFQIDGKMAFGYQSLSLAAFDLPTALDLLLVKNAG